MDSVIDKLAEIESNALKILDSANAQKKVLSDQMDQKAKEFDTQMDAQTEKNLSEIRQRLQKQNTDEIAALKTKTEQHLTDLDSYFQQHHTEEAKRLASLILK